MMHSSTMPGSMPARRTASATTSAPSCGAEKFLSEPRNLPVAVRTALTITDSCTDHNLPDDVLAEQRLHSPQDDPRGTTHLECPLGALCVNQQHALLEADRGCALQRRADRRLPREVDLSGRERRAAEKLGKRAGDGSGQGQHGTDLLFTRASDSRIGLP